MSLSYSTIVLYIKNQWFGALAQQYNVMNSLNFPYNYLAVLVRPSQAHKHLQSNPKPLQQISMKF